jgi:hypothetical protein
MHFFIANNKCLVNESRKGLHSIYNTITSINPMKQKSIPKSVIWATRANNFPFGLILLFHWKHNDQAVLRIKIQTLCELKKMQSQ